MNLYAFAPAHAKILSKQLVRISLPGLNSLDQMYLVALADTVARCKMDFADRFAESKEGWSGFVLLEGAVITLR
jgi:hypothetical protein